MPLTHNLDEEDPSRRYYVRHGLVPFDEDFHHEFKGHRNLSVDEMPPWTVTPNSDRRTRAPISRTINGFLNSGEGGTVYIGVLDSGAVKGLNLSLYQMDHVRSALLDLLSRYKPQVEPHRVSLRFVPIVDKDSSPSEVEQCLNHDNSKYMDPHIRQKQHIIRTANYCWCHKDALALANVGRLMPDYIIEIIVSPWIPDHPDNQHGVGEMKAPPVYEEECEQVYVRRQASVVNHTHQEVYEIAKQRVQIHYHNRLKELRNELESLRKEPS